MHLEAVTGEGARPGPPPMTVAGTPALSFSFPEAELGCNSSRQAREPWLGPQLQWVGE